jgi:endonuclease/exonuclease/phosphatase family metal-dependent hydrolase
VFFLSAIFAHCAAADTLRVVTYNILFFSENDDDRLDEIRTVMEGIRPDVAVFQEIEDEEAVDNLLSFVFLQIDDDWASAEFIDGYDTDNCLLYRTSRVNLISQRPIHTELRDINEYVLQAAELDSGEFIRMYSAHLKASEGSDNEERRREEAETLREELDELDEGSMFMFMGDFNLYTSAEPAYQLLLSPDPNPNGQLFDPIDTPGAWNNSASFADIHTQSPRTQSFGGGATGGLDDRFDFILVSDALMDTAGSYVIPSSYTEYGNDGQHFNQAVNQGTNFAVSDEIADALHAASDHLPVYADFVLRSTASPAEDTPPVVLHYELLECYPNPFNANLRVELSGITLGGEIKIFDVTGREIMSREVLPASRARTEFDFTNYGTGTYFVQFESAVSSTTAKVILLK